MPPLLCFEIILIVFSLLICYQNHLAENNLVHRDLAARNVLVGHDNQIKVSDFGLMRQIYEDVSSSAKSRKLPVKWMAPESLYQGVYTTKSDVWVMSFPAPLTRELLKLFYWITSQNCSCRQKLQKYITVKRLNSPYLFVTMLGLVFSRPIRSTEKWPVDRSF